eukprot:TRINITY_DN5874_c0_g1_i1.p1 TRINITY_DN5874_c0_g1~~TRINITY_DN5874_c0_g1_i1.p1  ORF type:complete len:288 (+),score=121.04 TRINITY_DN5874_c0_g1_i1:110-865(+)
MGNIVGVMRIVRDPVLEQAEAEPMIKATRQAPDAAMATLAQIMYHIFYVVAFFAILLPLIGGHLTLWTNFTEWWYILQNVPPWSWAALGCSLAIGLSIIGAAWGILMSGSSIAGAAIREPRIKSRNLISIIFCEAVGIYGLILALLMNGKIKNDSSDIYSDQRILASGLSYGAVQSCYSLFAAGICVGLGNLACGLSVGLVGSSCAIADAHDKDLFVQILIVEIFASALGIFALIIGILQSQHATFDSALS